MSKKRTVSAAALAALACAASVQAHHSGYMYETTAIPVKGAVVRFDRIGPHTRLTLEDRGADGQVWSWVVEGPPQTQLERRGIEGAVPQLGDVVEFCAFPYKSVPELSRLFPGADFSSRSSQSADGSSPQVVAGHVLTTADGAKRLWEPHGLIAECIRNSDDQRQSWLEFLNGSTDARQAWCGQRAHASLQSSESLRALVEDINRSIADPCD